MWQGSAPVRLGGRAWRVIEVVDGKALLLADQVVDRRPYHEEQVAVTWENCDLRRWLNDEFCESLGESLTSRVMTVKVRNEPNPAWGTPSGRDTKDQFFLLSLSEAALYFTAADPDVWEDYSDPIPCLGAYGNATDGRGKRAVWWLRSPGLDPDGAATVNTNGFVDANGLIVSMSAGVRPAFWLDLRS